MDFNTKMNMNKGIFCILGILQNIRTSRDVMLKLKGVRFSLNLIFLIKMYFLIKFIYSEKAKNFCKISTNYLTGSI